MQRNHKQTRQNDDTNSLSPLITTQQNSLAGTATVENETLHRSLLAARIANDGKNGKKAVDAPPVNIGWDSHEPVVSYRTCS